MSKFENKKFITYENGTQSKKPSIEIYTQKKRQYPVSACVRLVDALNFNSDNYANNLNFKMVKSLKYFLKALIIHLANNKNQFFENLKAFFRSI